uniref:Kinase n=2 Tax=Gadus morhua TaxID=8049 RepID=A0A8C4ZAZ8_GADMO
MFLCLQQHLLLEFTACVLKVEYMEWTSYHPLAVTGLETENKVNTTEEPTHEDIEPKDRREMTNDADHGLNERNAKEEAEEDDVSTDLPDWTRQGLSLRAQVRGQAMHGPFNRRPKLLSTKSFPPYSQPIGGLGQERESDPETESDYETGGSPAPDDSSQRGAGDALRLEEPAAFGSDAWTPATGRDGERRGAILRRDWGDGVESTEERDGGMTLDGWERRERWIGRRRPKGTGARGGGEGAQSRRDRERGGSDGGAKEQEQGDTHCILSEVEGEEGLICRRGRRTDKRTLQGVNGEVCQPHPILSKLLHFSSSDSSNSSFGLHSAHSEEVFSEGEDTQDYRQNTNRKGVSWKSLKTIMQWSLGRSSSPSWVQLAGHQGNFQLSDGGEVLKLFSPTEATCLELLMRDPLRPFVPQYHGLLTQGEERYTRLEDLLGGLARPVIMDVKMGVRTYQEDEMAKCHREPTLRSDMYHKMLKADPGAPSAEEHEQGAVTKWRYLRWRDTTTSTSTLGFRIEGIMMENGSVQRDFRKMLSLAQVTEVLLYFTKSRIDILTAYHCRLQALGDALDTSPFFSSHEVIGSSLLFVHDHSGKANVWMIDFGKTTPSPDRIRHDVQWAEGNREDGYLIGLASLTSSLHQAITLASQQQ